jgi:hypothetical protein
MRDLLAPPHLTLCAEHMSTQYQVTLCCAGTTLNSGITLASSSALAGVSDEGHTAKVS